MLLLGASLNLFIFPPGSPNETTPDANDSQFTFALWFVQGDGGNLITFVFYIY